MSYSLRRLRGPGFCAKRRRWRVMPKLKLKLEALTTNRARGAVLLPVRRMSGAAGSDPPPQPPRFTMVETMADARRAAARLMALGPDRLFAIDTETVGVDPRWQSPLGNALLISASIYCGPDADLGNGPHLWIDNSKEHLALEFRAFFEDPARRKLFHNFSFDRHVLENLGLELRGFAGDTMHMARLLDSDRLRYSLDALSQVYLRRRKMPFKQLFRGGPPEKTLEPAAGNCQKTPLDGVSDIAAADSPPETTGAANSPSLDGSKAKKAVGRTKDRGSDPEDSEGEAGDENPLRLMTSPATRQKWVDYCTYDAEATWRLYQRLRAELARMPWDEGRSMMAFYEAYLVPFGELLTRMEREGVHADLAALGASYERALGDLARPLVAFREWAAGLQPAARLMNPRSVRQVQQLLFAPSGGEDGHSTGLPAVHSFKAKNVRNEVREGRKKPTKFLEFEIRGLGMPPVSKTAGGKPQVNTDVLDRLAGAPFADPPRFGRAHNHFARQADGVAACRALALLSRARNTEKLINNYLETLRQHVLPATGRVHCSLNLNTNTGRISARSPNLQNQPAGDKDLYRVREAFRAAPGNKLVVADYGQLELRVLAHVAGCAAMAAAFAAGGDFHSRTAVAMFEHVRREVEAGRVVVDREGGARVGGVPTVKEKFSSERQKAKIFNFSIVYGKTVYGFSKDFAMEIEEVERYLALWYRERPEVKAWQDAVIREARKTGYTRTLMGRYRRISDIKSKNKSRRAHAERMAVNTPIQGGAADVVMMAMLRLDGDARLRALGWRLLLQVHDEVILEGPSASAAEALALAERHLRHPFREDLSVALDVSIAAVDNWSQGK